MGVVFVWFCSERWGVVEHTNRRGFSVGGMNWDKLGQGDIERSKMRHGIVERGTMLSKRSTE